MTQLERCKNSSSLYLVVDSSLAFVVCLLLAARNKRIDHLNLAFDATLSVLVVVV